MDLEINSKIGSLELRRRGGSLAEIGGFWRAMGLVERMGDINLANVSFIQ